MIGGQCHGCAQAVTRIRTRAEQDRLVRNLATLTWLNRLCIVMCGVMTFITAFAVWVLHIQSVTTMITGAVGVLACVFGILITYRWRPRHHQIIPRVGTAKLVCSTADVMHLATEGLYRHAGGGQYVSGHGSGPTGGYNDIRMICLEVPLLAGTHEAKIIDLRGGGGVPITNYWRCLVEMSDQGPVAICLQGAFHGRPSTLWWDLDRDDSAGGTFPHVQPFVQVINHLERFHTSVRDMDNRTDQLNAEVVELGRKLTDAQSMGDHAVQDRERFLRGLFTLLALMQMIRDSNYRSPIVADVQRVAEALLPQFTATETEEMLARCRERLRELLPTIELGHVNPDRLDYGSVESQAA